MTNGDLDPVWKALADPTRRRLLDLLKDGRRTTGDLCNAFDLSRFAVMKHLGVLEAAGLITVQRQGRERWNCLNFVPLRQIYERWLSPYQELWAGSLLRLKRQAEGHKPAGAPVSGAAALDNRSRVELEITQESNPL